MDYFRKAADVAAVSASRLLPYKGKTHTDVELICAGFKGYEEKLWCRNLKA